MSDDQLLDQAADRIAKVRQECLQSGVSPTELAELFLDDAILGFIAEGRKEREVAAFFQRVAKKRVRDWYAKLKRPPRA